MTKMLKATTRHQFHPIQATLRQLGTKQRVTVSLPAQLNSHTIPPVNSIIWIGAYAFKVVETYGVRPDTTKGIN